MKTYAAWTGSTPSLMRVGMFRTPPGSGSPGRRCGSLVGRPFDLLASFLCSRLLMSPMNPFHPVCSARQNEPPCPPAVGSKGRDMSLLVCVLGWAFANFLGHFRVFPGRDFFFNGDHIDPVPPIVSKVKPVAETASHFEAQRFDGRLVYLTCWGVIVTHVETAGQDVSACLRVHWAFAELKLEHVFFPPAKGIEDGVMQVCESLVASNLDGAGHRGVLFGEPF